MERSPASTAELAHLDAGRLLYLETLLNRILNSELAENTFAQVIDGAPTKSAFEKIVGFNPPLNEVVLRIEPSNESLDVFRDFRARFQLASIPVDSKILQAFQGTPIASESFHLRLLEVAALVVHWLGGFLYMTAHPSTDIRPQSRKRIGYYHYPIDLYHQQYQAYKSYPYGLLDTVAYWVETQIFGGVVIFEHDSAGCEISHAFIHQQGWEAFRLSNSQLEHIMDQSQSSSSHSGNSVALQLPFEPESNACILNMNDFYPSNIFRDEFSQIYPRSVQPSCVRYRTEEDEQMIRDAFALMERNHGKQQADGEDSNNQDSSDRSPPNGPPSS